MGKLAAPPLLQPLMFISPPPPPSQTNVQSSSFNLDSKISPSILLIIVILAIIFFVSGLLHLLVRCLLKPNQRDPDELDHVTVLQGQLQQLFHLHDAGVDQSYIDTLPVFYYKAIIGLKDPFDCAVCLCEFELEDKLRLLPKCSHAFHMDCIDTWLLSHSTCPLCRSSLLSDYGVGNHGCSPIVCVLESGSVENSREIGGGGGVGFERERVSVTGSNPHLGVQGDNNNNNNNNNNNCFGSSRVEFPRKSCDDDGIGCEKKEEKIMTIKLGKFRNVDGGEGSSENDDKNNKDLNSCNDNLGSRRCYSMGSFSYVLDETASLQVPIGNTPIKKQISKKANLPLKAGYRAAMSEYGCDSRREFNCEVLRSIDSFHVNSNENGNGKSLLEGIENGNGNTKLDSQGNENVKSDSQGNGNGDGRSKRSESFSISRIWSRGVERERNKKVNDYYESSRRTNSEFEIDVSEIGGDEETQSCYSVDSLAHPTTSTTSSSTRRTLLWLMGRQNKIVHNHSNSLSSNI